MDILSYFQAIGEAFCAIRFHEPTIGVIVAFCLSLFLLMCSGFVSASEIAFFSLSPSDINEVEEEKHSSDRSIIALREDSERLLANILICNNLVNIAIITLLDFVFMKVMDFGGSDVLQFLLMTVVLTFLLLLFGEVIPKIYSSQHTLAFCRFAAPKLRKISKLLSPLSNLLIRSKVVTRRFVHAGPRLAGFRRP